jgi:hypothetical protein
VSAVATVTTPPPPAASARVDQRQNPEPPIHPMAPKQAKAPLIGDPKLVSKKATAVSGDVAPRPAKKLEIPSPKAASLPGEIL